jgi:hypothetical protein
MSQLHGCSKETRRLSMRFCYSQESVCDEWNVVQGTKALVEAVLRRVNSVDEVEEAVTAWRRGDMNVLWSAFALCPGLQLGKIFMLPRPMFVLEVVQLVLNWHELQLAETVFG